MISVLSHRLLSNGNSNHAIWILIIQFLVFGSCSTPIKVAAPATPPKQEESKPEVYNPVTKKYEPANAQNTKVDTVQWRDAGVPPMIIDNTATHFPAERDKTKPLSISLLLPISDDELNKDLASEGTDKYFHYYSGVKMALNKINDLDTKVDIEVFDVKSSPDAIQSVLANEKVINSDLIIGPLRRDHLNETARFANDKNIPMVAPWNAFRTLENINQNYILLKSSLPTHCEILTEYILKQAKPTDIVLVGREKSKSLMSYFQAEIDKVFPSKPKLTQCVVKDNYKFGDEYKYLDSLKQIYIVTEFEEPTVVFNFLRHLNMMRRSKDITVIGMPSWQDYSRDYYSLFSQLRVIISASSYPDPTDEKVAEFRKAFFKLYQAFPMKEAYEGYDAIQYLVNQLAKYGRYFHLSNDGLQYNGLATPIKLEKIIDMSKPVDDRMKNSNIQCIENKALHILKFDQFKFVKVQ